MQAWKSISQSSFRHATRRGHALVRVPPQQPLLRRLHQQPLATTVTAPFKTQSVSSRPWTMSATRASQLYLVNQRTLAAPTCSRLSLARQTIRRGFASEAHSKTTTTTTVAPPSKPTFSQRIKDMVKKYGYTALAVYLGISALDLAATFVVVQALGMDKIKVAEDWVKEHVGPLIGYKGGKKEAQEGGEGALVDLDKVDDEQMGAIYNTASSLWSVFVIAYGIHKLLVPLRVVATSVLTPPLVKWLVRRGWIRDVTKKAVDATKSSAVAAAVLGLGVNTTLEKKEEEEEEQVASS